MTLAALAALAAAGGGMMSDDDMRALREATGAEFGQLWLSSMIKHHQGAIAMAEQEQQAGKYRAAVELAGRIMSTQQAEIDEMQVLLGTA